MERTSLNVIARVAKSSIYYCEYYMHNKLYHPRVLQEFQPDNAKSSKRISLLSVVLQLMPFYNI